MERKYHYIRELWLVEARGLSLLAQWPGQAKFYGYDILMFTNFCFHYLPLHRAALSLPLFFQFLFFGMHAVVIKASGLPSFILFSLVTFPYRLHNVRIKCIIMQ